MWLFVVVMRSADYARSDTPDTRENTLEATSYAWHNRVMRGLVGSRVGEKDQRVDEMVSLLDSWLPRSK